MMQLAIENKCTCGCGSVIRDGLRYKNHHGNRGRRFGERSLEIRKRLSFAMKGRKFNRKHLKNLSIAAKNRSLEHRRKLSLAMQKDGSSFWIDGRTSLKVMIQHSVTACIWRKAILERDSYTCQECGKTFGRLHVHHCKTKFSSLLLNFLNIHKQFSPSKIEDKYALARLSPTYEPFWNIDNGLTVCPKCHRRLEKEM